MKFKKLFLGILSVAVMVNSAASVSSAYKVGTVTGKVLSTDIVTYIDSVRVPSFNIAGRTAVIAENLNACGLDFSVTFSEETRTLHLEKSSAPVYDRGYFHFDVDTSSKAVGTPIMNVLYTDIKTVFGTTQMESFNIGGFTCIYADDLAKLCGEYIWDENARTVNVTTGKKVIPGATVVQASRTLPGLVSGLTKSDSFARWGEEAKSYITPSSDGGFTTIEIDENINIESYDKEFNLVNSFAIKKELPLFGGLYFGRDFNYIAFGQENLLCDNSREVIKIVIYDKNFVKISEVSVNNCKTTIPFDASAGEMYEDDRYLVLHTSRTQYPDEQGNSPQTQLTVIVDKHTWQVVNMLGKFQHNHTSHALREFVRLDGGKIVTANYSDAAPLRGAFLQELDAEGKILHTQSLFNVGGALGANCTGAMLGGFELSDSGYLATMSTIDHSVPTGYSNVNIDGIDKENRDIFLIWTDKVTREMKHTCLAWYRGTEYTGSTPYLVKLSDGNFMILWQQFSDYSEESNTVCIAFSDKDGNQLGATHSVKAQLSKGCMPVEVNSKVVWYVNTEGGRTFFELSADEADYVVSEVSEETTVQEPASEAPEEDKSEILNEYISEENPVVKEESIPVMGEVLDEDSSEKEPAKQDKKPPIVVDGI